MDLFPMVVAGASGAFVKEFASKGVEWLIQLMGSHSQTVQAQVEQNARNFLVRLAERVQRLEEELPAAQREVFDSALGHPSLSLLMQKALISASVTDNDDRHSILSELIARRLSAEDEDMIALVGSAACDVVSALSSTHIRLLGLMAHLFFFNPPPEQPIRNQEEFLQILLSFWRELEKLCDRLDSAKRSDILHLAGLSCILINRGAARDLELTLSPWLNMVPWSSRSDLHRPDFAFLKQQSWWQRFQRIWALGFQNVFLTSTGLLIGVLFRDGSLKKLTRIDFDKFY
jgi:hypothetical protein